nr:hypothetical protein [Haliscomenobacter sp.]
MNKRFISYRYYSTIGQLNQFVVTVITIWHSVTLNKICGQVPL